jgi:hypothetical protein
MRTIIACLTWSLLTAWSVADLKQDIPKSHRVILKKDWAPSPEETLQALPHIEAFLNHPSEVADWSKGQIKIILSRLKTYRVQFIGVTRHGKKLIWCNFFPDTKEVLSYWEKTPVEVADGGASFWQIYYDPTTGQCSNFISNGYG